jgi:hypothetical protein
MTSKEIEELAGHTPVSAWVVKLVADAVAAEREACAKLVSNLADDEDEGELFRVLKHASQDILARGKDE